MKKRFFRWVILLVSGFAIGTLIGQYQLQYEQESGEKTVANVVKKPSKLNTGSSDVGGAFTLIDNSGKTVTENDFSDTHKLVFFGFTYCPAVCPTELQKMNLILDELGELADQITPIFITVDPERDTVEVMDEYVKQFHPKLVGLTGSREQIDQVMQAFRVYATKVENEMMEGYMMDHSAYIYLTDKNNQLVSFYPSTDTALEVAGDIKVRGL